MSGRSAALAALLTEAPQCVPFNQRVLIFRSLVTADKERCAVQHLQNNTGTPGSARPEHAQYNFRECCCGIEEEAVPVVIMITCVADQALCGEQHTACLSPGECTPLRARAYIKTGMCIQQIVV